ncbi:MAG TPA: glycosyltransferase [Flavobacterium sp.]|nr:glycosyltransferase [Flavobacterium sp.]
MRIVQLIDSLEAGGAEKMAVTYANALSEVILFSGLVATRNEGPLKDNIVQKENYLFLNRKKTVDFKALTVFKNYIKNNKIEIIHAHSSSVYFAFLTKIMVPKIKIIWHDHYGNSEMLKKRGFKKLKIVSLFLFGIVSVNHQLKKWAEKKLWCKKIIYLPNFIKFGSIETLKKTQLKGSEGKRILCLANLRPQKNHEMLINIVKSIKENYPNYTFHLVGKDFNDSYSRKIKDAIQQNELQENVFIYGSKPDIFTIINQASIGILTSNSEGLPVALLEYAMGKLAVICTNVGEISSIIKDNENGFLIEPSNERAFTNALTILINDDEKRQSMAQNLHDDVLKLYHEKQIIAKYKMWILD